MTDWWNKYINDKRSNRLGEFLTWILPFEEGTRSRIRKYVKECGYSSFLDVGCGLAVEFFGFIHDNNPVKYTGLDSCQYFIDSNRWVGIPMVEANMETRLPLADNSYQCVYGREIIEHLSYYYIAIDEFIRVAEKEAIIIWFINPDDQKDQIKYTKEEDVFHNRYNIGKLERFIFSNPKVDRIIWEKPSKGGAVLHIINKVPGQNE